MKCAAAFRLGDIEWNAPAVFGLVDIEWSAPAVFGLGDIKLNLRAVFGLGDMNCPCLHLVQFISKLWHAHVACTAQASCALPPKGMLEMDFWRTMRRKLREALAGKEAPLVVQAYGHSECGYTTVNLYFLWESCGLTSSL